MKLGGLSREKGPVLRMLDANGKPRIALGSRWEKKTLNTRRKLIGKLRIRYVGPRKDRRGKENDSLDSRRTIRLVVHGYH